MAGHDSLLLQPTVVLEGQDDRVWGQLRGEGQQLRATSPSPYQDPHYTWPPTPFRTGRQRHSGGLSRWNVGHAVGPVCPWGDRGQIWGLRERVECLGS